MANAFIMLGRQIVVQENNDYSSICLTVSESVIINDMEHNE